MFKKPTDPTFEEIIAATAAKRGAALSVFALAIEDLHAASAEAIAAEYAIDEEISRLTDLRVAATLMADGASQQAQSLAVLIG